MNFDIKTEQLGDDAYVISLAGEVGLYTAPEFKQQLLEVIGQGGKHVIVDFSDTTFIDSTTLGVLVGGVKRLRTNEGQLAQLDVKIAFPFVLCVVPPADAAASEDFVPATVATYVATSSTALPLTRFAGMFTPSSRWAGYLI